MGLPVYFLGLPSVIGVLCKVVLCTLELQPQGNELVCPTTQISRTLICNVTGTSLKWDITSKDNSPTTEFFTRISGVPNRSFDVNGIEGSLISATDNSVTSQLVISNGHDLLPLTITCTDVDNTISLSYSLMVKESPDSPSNVNVSKTNGINDNYTISWQAPATASGNKPVEEYNLSITSISVPPSPTQSFTTKDNSISLLLNHSTNYTVSLRSSNCAGVSAEVTYEITRDIIQPALDGNSTMPTTINASTTASTMPVMSSDSTGGSLVPVSTLSPPQTSGLNVPITSGSTPGSSNNPFPFSGMLLTIIGAVLGAIALLIVVIVIVTAFIVCYRRKSSLKTVSMEMATSTSQGNSGSSENGIYNKLKAYPGFETPELQKQFHNPQYAELQSSTSSEKDHIYHVLEGPDPNTKLEQDQVYAEVGDPVNSSYNSSHERWPDKSSVTTENVRLKPQGSSHATSTTNSNTTHLRYHQTPSTDFPTQTWNYSVH